MSLLERAGGRVGLRRVVTAFYDAVFDDLMIGFFFRGQDKARLVDREVELMAEHFGDEPGSYRGRPMARAHARHRILGAHFDRRAVILRETLERLGVAPEVRDAWLAHTAASRAEIVRPERCDM